MNTISDLAITSIDTITAFTADTGDFMFSLDELQNAKLAQSEEKTDITGKQGRKLNSLKKNKAVTISGSNGLVSAGLMGLQAGGKAEVKEDGSAEVMWCETVKVNTNASATTYKAIGTANEEIDALYIKDSSTGTLGKKLEQASEVSPGKFKYEESSKALTFHTGEVPDNSEVVVYYKRKLSKATVLKNESDKYSGKATLYVDATGEDICANIYHIQIVIPKADFNGNFELSFGDSQTVHSFEAEALAGTCGGSGEYWTYIIFGDTVSDHE